MPEESIHNSSGNLTVPNLYLHTHLYIQHIHTHILIYNIYYTHNIGFMWVSWHYGHSLKNEHGALWRPKHNPTAFSPQTAMCSLLSHHQQPRDLVRNTYSAKHGAYPREAMQSVMGTQPCSPEVCKHQRITTYEKQLAQKRKPTVISRYHYTLIHVNHNVERLVIKCEN